MNNAIQKVSKNNKLKGYAGEVTHAVCDLLYFVEQDRLAIGEVFNALKRLRKKARDH
jgi:ATP-dependent protease HslVU (ClpYQ) peptidase subunit